jgi:hypothetical protein
MVKIQAIMLFEGEQGNGFFATLRMTVTPPAPVSINEWLKQEG